MFFSLKKGVFSFSPQTSGKEEFKSAQLLELLENIHSPQLENSKKKKVATSWNSKLCA